VQQERVVPAACSSRHIIIVVVVVIIIIIIIIIIIATSGHVTTMSVAARLPYPRASAPDKRCMDAEWSSEPV
jgi:amino acid transporter